MTQSFNHVIITPEMARDYLSRSAGNRNISKPYIAKLAAEIKSGNWKYNGDRIRFLQDGTLHDGHHRLTACVESGIPIVTDIFIMPDDAVFTVDKGRSRSIADNLVMESGAENSKASAISAAIRQIITHDYTALTDWPRAAFGGGNQTYAKFYTDSFIIETYRKIKDDLYDCFDWIEQNIKRQNLLLTKSQCVSFLYLASREYGKDAARDYLKQVLTGYGVEPETTADHIRNALLAVKMRQRKMTATNKLFTLCKGFKSIMAGRNIKYAGNAVYRPNTDTAPRFEVIKNG